MSDRLLGFPGTTSYRRPRSDEQKRRDKIAEAKAWLRESHTTRLAHRICSDETVNRLVLSATGYPGSISEENTALLVEVVADSIASTCEGSHAPTPAAVLLVRHGLHLFCEDQASFESRVLLENRFGGRKTLLAEVGRQLELRDAGHGDPGEVKGRQADSRWRRLLQRIAPRRELRRQRIRLARSWLALNARVLVESICTDDAVRDLATCEGVEDTGPLVAAVVRCIGPICADLDPTCVAKLIVKIGVSNLRQDWQAYERRSFC